MTPLLSVALLFTGFMQTRQDIENPRVSVFDSTHGCEVFVITHGSRINTAFGMELVENKEDNILVVKDDLIE